MSSKQSHRGPSILYLASVLLAISACNPEPQAPCRNDPPGFLITNVQLVDGSGSPARPADVRVNDGLVADIGRLTACDDETVIDGDGQVLAPGFIDTHSHADGNIDEVPDALAAVSQGITTVIIGQDGGSQFPLAEYFLKLEESPSTVNFASYVGHNRIRSEVLGEDNKRAATEAEVAAMAELLASELRSGALGLSTGLEYEPGIYAETAEVIALAKVTAAAGGRYISHLRSEDRWLDDSIDEIILIGRETGMPVQISHFKLAMTPLWGSAATVLEKLDAARASGVRISADIYPYEYWQSTMMVLLPERDYTDRAAVEEALDTIAPAAGIWLTLFEPEPDYVGKSLTEIAALLETDAVDAFMQLARMADEWQSPDGGRAEMIIATSMHEDDIRTLLLWPETNICSDGGLMDLHPRGAGSFPRILGRYVREEELLSLESAVHKMTGLAAKHMGFTDRGVIRQGAVADLVLFDPATVIDRATPDDPGALAVGIASVWVGGELVYAGGATTAARPGKVIRRLLQ